MIGTLFIQFNNEKNSSNEVGTIIAFVLQERKQKFTNTNLSSKMREKGYDPHFLFPVLASAAFPQSLNFSLNILVTLLTFLFRSCSTLG